MPATHVDFGVVGRARPGRVDRGSAVAACAYNAAARFEHNGKAYDYTRKRREHVGGCVLLPLGADPTLSTPGALWRAAEAAEKRIDAQTARQVLVALPRECPAHLRLDLARAIAAPWVADGMGVQLDVHCPHAADGGEQPHAHYLLTLRRVTDGGLAATKERSWNEGFREGKGRGERARIADRVSEFLSAHGINARIAVARRDDGTPPEPTAPREDWKRWRRDGADPTTAPAAVADVLAHRERRRDLDRARDAVIDARTEIVTVEHQITRWSDASGDLDGLTPSQRAAATRAHAVWRARQQDERRREMALADYVEYVQRRRRRVREATDTPPPGACSMRQVGGASPADRSAPSGWTAVQDDGGTSWRTTRGTTLHDRGDVIEMDGAATRDSARDLLELAAWRGWTSVTLTGDGAFRDEAAIAAALRRPPIVTDHQLSERGQTRLAAALRARGSAPSAAASSPRDVAMAAALAAERSAGTSSETSTARRTTAALVDGDPAVIDALSRGDVEAAAAAAAAWQHRRVHERARPPVAMPVATGPAYHRR